MKIRIVKSVRVLVTIACVSLGLDTTVGEPADPFAPGESGKTSGIQEGEIREPNYDVLGPVDEHPEEYHVRYMDQVSKHLDLNQEFEIRMLILPSFSGESVISLQKTKNSKETPHKGYRLVYRRCSSESNIWYSMPENNEQNAQKKVTVESAATVFPEELVPRIRKVWDRMLGRVSPSQGGGLDGTTYEFAAGKLRGETWSPSQPKSPRLFVELGGSLIGFCGADDKGKPEALKAIEEKLSALEKYLDEHP